MNTGIFGEGFPYSNFHDFNMDWIIKIAKDFLDQYSTIQQTITDGLTALEEKKTTLEEALQAWYDEHSNDIANQLADALQDLNAWYTEHSNDISTQLSTALNTLNTRLTQNITLFDTHANEKGAEVLESIPEDYTDLSNAVTRAIEIKNNYFNPATAVYGKFYDGTVGNAITTGDNSVFIGSIFEVIEGHTYVLAKSNFRWFELDDDNIVLSRNGDASEHLNYSITPNTSGVKKVAISWSTNDNAPADTYMILDYGHDFDRYAPYPYAVFLTEECIHDTELLTGNIVNNYFNSADAQNNCFLDGQVGQEISASTNNDYAGIIFPVERGRTYVVYKSNWRWFELDEDNVILSRNGDAYEKYKFSITPTTSGVKKVAVSWSKNNNMPISRYKILDPGVSFNKRISYPYSIYPDETMLSDTGITPVYEYYVGQGGDFTTFTEMLTALENDETHKIVYVGAGTYNIFNELGGSTYIQSITSPTTADWREVQKLVPKNTKIVGIGDVTLTWNPTDNEIIDADHAWLFSAINISDSCEIENINVSASNCRYAIHIESADGSGDENTAVIKLRNVNATREATTLAGNHQCVGCGIGKNAKWYFENCIFRTTAGNHALSVHTNGTEPYSSNMLVFDNCVFDTIAGTVPQTSLLAFINQGQPDIVTNRAFINNCYVRGKIETMVTSANVPKRQTYDIAVIGGTSYGLVNASNKEQGYDISNYGHTIAQ